MTALRLACLDMAGTTVLDDGLVMRAFERAMERSGISATDEVMSYVETTMGRSKIEVFTAITGDVLAAQSANAAFEKAYADLVDEGAASMIPGALGAFAAFRELGMKVCLTTGFAPVTRDMLVRALNLHSQVDLVLSPQDTVSHRGRPTPDMILTALMRLGIDSVDQIAVAGDTASDVLSGVNAGARVVAGVLTGMHDRATLAAAGATHILDSIADMPAVCRASH